MAQPTAVGNDLRRKNDPVCDGEENGAGDDDVAGHAAPVVQDRAVANSKGFVEFVVEQLDEMGDVTVRPMFGGHGLYAGPAFFAIVYDDRVYLKTDDVTRPWFEERGMGPFRPNERQEIKSYYEVPPDTIEDRAELVELALSAARQPR